VVSRELVERSNHERRSGAPFDRLRANGLRLAFSRFDYTPEGVTPNLVRSGLC
jgi:hypothetical protein